MDNDRVFVKLELPGETVVLDVPRVAPQGHVIKPAEPSGHVVNMVWNPGEKKQVDGDSK